MNEICEDKIYHLPLEWDAMPNEHMDEIKNLKLFTIISSLSHGISLMFNMVNISGMLLKNSPYYDELKNNWLTLLMKTVKSTR